ncbi:hypothetical protein EAL2_c20080 [Peptoclostridium acidaminophilum DSM 3953]|uniref:Glycosyl transferase family 1 domain-containing protein n=1 Tax=Peptoclostridium acidaminophilum DSM 3953 TaxID=1286171 RepID=W8T6B2_PEPAC|nr:glycosyltransferase family 4 protein [Peptoclostridium acidaminophilum]AHM57289.1 hypothetical protein EAL2_c20080 [Peptoclostridium acidaminophilum DSM 3953]
MKILYVTPPWPGFRECLFDGEIEPQGLPSFNKPLMGLVEEGHQIDFVILNSAYRPEYKYENLNIKADWLKKSHIWDIVETDLSLQRRFVTYSNLKKSVKKALSSEKYDFVYAHGSSTSVVRMVAKKYNVPFGQRLYGTFLWDKIQKKGKKYVSIRHITEYRAFKTKKNFLLVTNDGSRGDLVKKVIWGEKKPPFEFYYWINGVNKAPIIEDADIEEYSRTLVKKPFIFHVARFDSWKRQDRVVKIIAELKKRGRDIHLYLAGPNKTIGNSYFDSITKLIKELDIEDRVTYMGNIDIKTMNVMCKLAMASFSLNDVCNLTNVFHEMLAAGAVVIVQKDGTTEGFIDHGINGFYVNNNEKAVELIENLLCSRYKVDDIRRAAIKTSEEKMKTWKQRIADEINLIKKHAGFMA